MRSGTVEPVVVGIDGSGPAVRAVAWAAEEALLRGRPLMIVFALCGEPDAHARTAAGPALCRARTIALAGRQTLDVCTTLPPGDPVTVLSELSGAAELLVVGHRGAGGLDGLVIGSTATALARTSHAPVVVVRPAPGRPVPDRDRPVVVGVDATPDSRPAVEFAVRLAEQRGSDLLAVHIYTEHAADILRRLGCRETEPAREAGARLLAECLTGQAERFPDLRIRPEVIRGWSPWTLVELSDSAQMIVVGRGEPGGRRRRGLGGCAIGLLRASSCPVAIVPAQVIPRRAGSVRTAPQPAESPHETPHGCATESHHPAGRAT